MRPLKDAFDEMCKGDTDVPECVESWWHLLTTHLSPTHGETIVFVSIQDLLGQTLLFYDEFHAFRQQLLLMVSGKLEQLATGNQVTREQIEDMVCMLLNQMLTQLDGASGR